MLNWTCAYCLYKLCEVPGIQSLSKPKVQISFNKMLQRLAVTFPKNVRMNPHGVNQTLSIFLLTPSPVAMQGLDATAP